MGVKEGRKYANCHESVGKTWSVVLLLFTLFYFILFFDKSTCNSPTTDQQNPHTNDQYKQWELVKCLNISHIASVCTYNNNPKKKKKYSSLPPFFFHSRPDSPTKID